MQPSFFDFEDRWENLRNLNAAKNAAKILVRLNSQIDWGIFRAQLETIRLKEGETPEDWSEPKHRQKDTDARHTKKRKKSFFGYKNHANVNGK